MLCICRGFGKLISTEKLRFRLIADKIHLSYEELTKAKRNEPETLFSIGREYYNRFEYGKAVHWFTKVLHANSKHIAANHMLGYMFSHGLGVIKSPSFSFQYFKKSAENSDIRGAFNLGYIYQHGFGTFKDIKLAIEWYTLAASSDAYEHDMKGIRDIYKDDLVAFQEFKVQKRWFYIANKNVKLAANLSLADIYWNGPKSVKNIRLALIYYNRAAIMGCDIAVYNTGVIYEEEVHDKRQAVEWYKKSSEREYPPAIDRLVKLHSEGFLPTMERNEFGLPNHLPFVQGSQMDKKPSVSTSSKSSHSSGSNYSTAPSSLSKVTTSRSHNGAQSNNNQISNFQDNAIQKNEHQENGYFIIVMHSLLLWFKILIWLFFFSYD